MGQGVRHMLSSGAPTEEHRLNNLEYQQCKPVGCSHPAWSSSNEDGVCVELEARAQLYGAHLYISMKDRAKLGSHKLSNIYVSSSEVVWEWMVVPLWSNGQKTRCATWDHCLIWHYQIW